MRPGQSKAESRRREEKGVPGGGAVAPNWPDYSRYTVHTAGFLFSKVAVLAVAWLGWDWLRELPVLGSPFVLVPLVVALLAGRPLVVLAVNLAERRVWERSVGRVLRWKEGVSRYRRHPGRWVVLYHPLPLAGSMGTYQFIGGFDAFMLLDTQTKERYALRGPFSMSRDELKQLFGEHLVLA